MNYGRRSPQNLHAAGLANDHSAKISRQIKSTRDGTIRPGKDCGRC